jgi:predicted ATPase
MTEAKRSSKNNSSKNEKGITKISVCGYKSLKDECTIDIYPLTILAGANSSGKSSIIQPLLLMKQTLEASYNPGALLLNGSNIRFTSVEQLLSNSSGNDSSDSFYVETEADKSHRIKNVFKKDERKGIELSLMQYKSLTRSEEVDNVSILTPELTEEEVEMLVDVNLASMPFSSKIPEYNYRRHEFHSIVIRNRCFFEIEVRDISNKRSIPTFGIAYANDLSDYIRQIIHVPGLRGNPERTYKIAAVENEFPGTFENYVASIIANWQEDKNPKLTQLARSLKDIGLTEKIDVRKVDDTQVEVRVGNRRKNTTDMVSIADVGFGVSQTLPVVVALIAAEPEQLVYIEQPEIHLHPRAQAALSDIIVEAVNRGVRVILETHSDLFLRRIQSLVAEDKLAPDRVKLHWFSKDENGFTQVSTADLDTDGSFGDWPEDFGDVDLQEESRYLDAADRKLAQKSHG